MPYIPLSSIAGSNRKSNNFDALRLFAAFLVFYSHSFALFGRSEPVFLAASDGFKSFSIGAVGVTIFFVISGYLIPASWENGRRVFPYLLKRAARIYPGLAVNFIIVYALVIPFFCTVSPQEYLAGVLFTKEWFLRLGKSLVMMQSLDLNIVFNDNPVPYLVNGPLWTLQYEVFMYLAVLVTGLTVGFRKYFFVVPLFFFVFLFAFEPLPVTEGDLALFFSGGFVFGSCLYVFRKIIPYSKGLFLFCLLLLVGMSLGGLYPLPLFLAALSYVVIFIAFTKIPKLNRAGAFGDLSFGVYIYAWPVQQILAPWFVEGDMFWGYMFASLVLTLICAVFSWHLIEGPVLALKSHYFASEREAH